jgi:hypothetical protein
MPDVIHPERWNSLQGGGNLAAELPATQPGYRRWVSVYRHEPPTVPFAPRLNNFPPHEYSVLVFELKNELHDIYFGGEDLLRKERHFANSETELYEVLEKIGVMPSSLTYPWRCDYPL